MEVQFRLMRRHGEKAYILSEITGYDERLPVVLAASTEAGIRIPSDSFPYCNPTDPTEVEAVLFDGSLANHQVGDGMLHTRNTVGVRFFVIVLPWMNIRRWVMEFNAIDSSGTVVQSCVKHVDLGSFGFLSMMGRRTNALELNSIRKLDGRFIHDRITVDFLRAVEEEDGVLVSASVEMPFHPQSVIEFDFLGDHGQKLDLEPYVVEDSISHTQDLGEYNRRHMVISFRIDRAEPQVCLCATDTVGNVAPGFAMLGAESLFELLRDMAQRTMAADEDPDYDDWYRHEHQVDLPTLLEQVSCRFEQAPLYSVVATIGRSPIHHVHGLISSLRTQSYGRWELVLVNDGDPDPELDDLLTDLSDDRIFVVQADAQSRWEAMLVGIAAAEGEFVMVMGACDMLASDTLFEVTRKINEHPICDMVYSDVDTIDAEGVHFDPLFLPDFSPDLLRSYGYIKGFAVVRSTVLEQAIPPEGFLEGAEEYDFLLRVTEHCRYVGHVPRVLCHRRYAALPPSYDQFNELDREAYRKALVHHCSRRGITAEVLPTSIPLHFRVRHVMSTTPSVSIVIVTHSDAERLTWCLRSLYTKISYRNFDVLVIDQGESTSEKLEAYESLKARYETLSVRFSDASNRTLDLNAAARSTTGDYLLFLNDDARIMSEDLLETMLGYFQVSTTGIVGPKRLFVDGTIDHAGLAVGGANVVTPLFRFMPAFWNGYLNRAMVAQDVTAVAQDCMMVKRSVFEEAGGFTEELTTSYAGIDFCLKIKELGYYTVFTPFAVLGHFRGVSRIHVESASSRIKMQREASLLRYLWPEVFVQGDDLFNQNLDSSNPYYCLRH